MISQRDYWTLYMQQTVTYTISSANKVINNHIQIDLHMSVYA
jgi:hypothetical protein